MKRIKWVDLGKCICILFVMISHMSYVPELLRCLFKPVFLTFFFFLSGYVFNSDRPFPDFLRRRVRSILLLALLFSVVYLVDVRALLSGAYSPGLLAADLSRLLFQRRGEGDVLWFLYVNFLASIPLYAVTRCMKERGGLLLSFVGCQASIVYVRHFMERTPCWYIHIVFVAMFIMMCGYACRNHEKELIRVEKWELFAPAAFLYLWLVLRAFYRDGLYVNINEYGVGAIYWYLTVFTGIYIMIFICRRCEYGRLTGYIGANTIIFYLFHDRVRNVFDWGIRRAGLYQTVLGSQWAMLACTVCSLVFVTSALLVISACVNRYFPWLVGKRRIKTEIRQ